MPSTYTPAGIELIADGEQSGTWGQTTNTNWELAEELATGVVSISVSSTSYSLSVVDGASSNGRNAVVVFTGSPGGTCTVTVSPNDMEKVYWVVNNTDETLTFTQGSGANVSIPASQKKIIYCDGTGGGAAVVDLTSAINIGSAFFNDNSKATFGTGGDLEIYHDGTDNYVSDQSGNSLKILTDSLAINNAADDETLLTASQNGAATLYYANVAAITTTNTGAEVTGVLNATTDVQVNGTSVATTGKAIAMAVVFGS